MPEEFIALASWLNGERREVPVESETPEEVRDSIEVSSERDDASPAVDALLSQVRCFGAALAEAVERAAERILVDIAAEVVARELALAPPALHEIVGLALRRYGYDAPIAIRAHPTEVKLLDKDYRVIADDDLRSGDIVLEVSDGVVDARLGLRLERVLRKSS